MREYSIYSPVTAPYLEILVKLVEGGLVSNRLAKVRGGDALAVDGPFGFFTIDEEARGEAHYFIATGTGIAPFHAIVGSQPDLDYQLLHGIRSSGESYEHDAYNPTRVVRCTSREAASDYPGRVTTYLRQHPLNIAGRYYLCGNCDMIYEAFDILQNAGVPHAHLFAEVYF